MEAELTAGLLSMLGVPNAVRDEIAERADPELGGLLGDVLATQVEEMITITMSNRLA